MDHTPLDRLKNIAAGSKPRPEKPMALRASVTEDDDTLELRADNIVEDAEFEEMESDENAQENNLASVSDSASKVGSDSQEEGSSTAAETANMVDSFHENESPTSAHEIPETEPAAPTPTIAPEPATTAENGPAPVVAKEEGSVPEGDINDLISGKLLPHVSLPITQAGNYDVMNEMLKKGKVNLGEVNGAPHIVLTANALDDIIDEKKNDARGTVEAIEKTENEISDLEKRIEALREERGSLLDAASVSRDEISKLQNLRSGLK